MEPIPLAALPSPTDQRSLVEAQAVETTSSTAEGSTSSETISILIYVFIVGGTALAVLVLFWLASVLRTRWRSRRSGKQQGETTAQKQPPLPATAPSVPRTLPIPVSLQSASVAVEMLPGHGGAAINAMGNMLTPQQQVQLLQLELLQQRQQMGMLARQLQEESFRSAMAQSPDPANIIARSHPHLLLSSNRFGGGGPPTPILAHSPQTPGMAVVSERQLFAPPMAEHFLSSPRLMQSPQNQTDRIPRDSPQQSIPSTNTQHPIPSIAQARAAISHIPEYREGKQQAKMEATMVNEDVLSFPGFLEKQVKEHYRLRKKIASGGMGEIWTCDIFDVELKERAQQERMCIAKISTLPVDERGGATKIFEQEVSIMYHLREHPNIAKIIGFSKEPLTILTVFYPLGSLSTLIRKGMKDFRWSVQWVAWFTKDIASGLQFMHSKSIAHRDIKPANVLLHASSQRMIGVITDFGISEILDDKANVASGFHVNNLAGASVLYAAPDAIERMYMHNLFGVPQKVIKSGDSYSLAMVMVEMLNRKTPWHSAV